MTNPVKSADDQNTAAHRPTPSRSGVGKLCGSVHDATPAIAASTWFTFRPRPNQCLVGNLESSSFSNKNHYSIIKKRTASSQFVTTTATRDNPLFQLG